MHLTITIKAAPTSEEERQTQFTGRFNDMKKHFEMLQAENFFGPHSELRFLVSGYVRNVDVIEAELVPAPVVEQQIEEGRISIIPEQSPE